MTFLRFYISWGVTIRWKQTQRNDNIRHINHDIIFTKTVTFLHSSFQCGVSGSDANVFSSPFQLQSQDKGKYFHSNWSQICLVTVRVIYTCIAELWKTCSSCSSPDKGTRYWTQKENSCQSLNKLSSVVMYIVSGIVLWYILAKETVMMDFIFQAISNYNSEYGTDRSFNHNCIPWFLVVLKNTHTQKPRLLFMSPFNSPMEENTYYSEWEKYDFVPHS